MLTSLLLVLLVLLVSAVYMAAGRMVYSHVGAKRDATPFNSLLVGLGCWYAWFLVLHTVAGASLTITWYTFLVSVIALSVVLTRIHKFDDEQALFWPAILVGLLLVAPALYYLTTDGPVLWAELSHYLKNADHMLRLDTVPDMKTAMQLDIFDPAAHVAGQILGLPVMLMLRHYEPATATLMNVVLLVAAAGQLVRHCGIHIRWNNLVFVTATALFGMTLFNPFFVESIVFSAYPDVLIACVLFAFVSPLMRPQALPNGLALLPQAIIAVYLVGLLPLGLWVFAFVGIFWVLRSLLERQQVGAWQLFGWSLLGLLPMIGWLLWQNYLLRHGDAGFPQVHLLAYNLPTFLHMLKGGASLALSWPVIMALMLIVLGMAVRRLLLVRGMHGLRRFLVDEAGLSFPLIFFVVYIVFLGAAFNTQFPEAGGVFEQGWLHDALHLQLIFLAPVWLWLYHVSAETFDFSANKKASGAMALASALLFVGVILANGQRLTFTPPAPLDHTLRVAASVRDNDTIGWGERLAVLDSPETHGYYAVAMSYGLRQYAHVRPVLQEFASANGDFNRFHDALRAKGFTYLWIHAATPQIAAVLGGDLREDYSYLYRITADGLVPVATYPHASYTYKSAAFVPHL